MTDFYRTHPQELGFIPDILQHIEEVWGRSMPVEIEVATDDGVEELVISIICRGETVEDTVEHLVRFDEGWWVQADRAFHRKGLRVIVTTKFV